MSRKALTELYKLIEWLKLERQNWKPTNKNPYNQILLKVLQVYNSLGGVKISNQQMAYFHAVIVPMFCDYTGDSPEYTEKFLKLKCGIKWFEPEIITIDGVNIATLPTKTKLSRKDFCEWYENITNFGLEQGIVVPAPDPEWRKKESKK